MSLSVSKANLTAKHISLLCLLIVLTCKDISSRLNFETSVTVKLMSEIKIYPMTKILDSSKFYTVFFLEIR